MKNNPYNNFLTVRPIFTINISIASSLQAEEYGNIKKFSNFILVEHPGIFMKNTSNSNFLAVLLIYTMNIPIGSAQQVDNSETSKIPKFDCRGSIGKFHEKIPQTITFQLFNRFPQTVYRSIQVDKRRTWNHQTCFKSHSRGATGEFS